MSKNREKLLDELKNKKGKEEEVDQSQKVMAAMYASRNEEREKGEEGR